MKDSKKWMLIKKTVHRTTGKQQGKNSVRVSNLQTSRLRRKETHFVCQVQASASQWSQCGSPGPYKTGMTVSSSSNTTHPDFKVFCDTRTSNRRHF